jgi:hypothetical protein
MNINNQTFSESEILIYLINNCLDEIRNYDIKDIKEPLNSVSEFLSILKQIQKGSSSHD